MHARRVLGAAALATIGLVLVAGPAAAPNGGNVPDLKIRRAGELLDAGEDVINTSGTQSLSSAVGFGNTATWIVTVENQGAAPGRYRIHGGAGNADFAVKYVKAGKNITKAVRKGSYQTARLAPEEEAALKLKITGKAGAGEGDVFHVNVVVTASTFPGAIDLVRAAVNNI